MGSSSQVTLVFPLFNTLSRLDSSGQPLVDRMVGSIAAQTVAPARVLVLDNQSDDGSAEYVSRIADPRVNLTVTRDSERRPPEEAINVLMQQVETPFVSVVNDDDALSPTYIENLVDQIRSSRAGLVYPNGQWLRLDGTSSGRLVVSRRRTYGSFRSAPENLRRYLRIRNPVPMIFGLWQTHIAQSVFAIKRIDAHSHDLDNMILATTLGRGVDVSFVDHPLFFYSVREGHRAPPEPPTAGARESQFAELLAANWSHHVRFSAELLRRVYPPNQAVGQYSDSPITELVISQELRRRLAVGVTWALSLTRPTKRQFTEVSDLRRILASVPSGRWRRSFAGVLRQQDSRRALESEIRLWREFHESVYCQQPNEWSLSARILDLSGDIADLIRQLGTSNS
jgi:glycosyltransferase involved in cell wall biosynthesis